LLSGSLFIGGILPPKGTFLMAIGRNVITAGVVAENVASLWSNSRVKTWLKRGKLSLVGYANPVLAKGLCLWASVETLYHATAFAVEEKVRTCTKVWDYTPNHRYGNLYHGGEHRIGSEPGRLGCLWGHLLELDGSDVAYPSRSYRSLGRLAEAVY